MGNKKLNKIEQKAAQMEQNGEKSSKKRKKLFPTQPAAKRKKIRDESNENGESDDFKKRFQYVLAPNQKNQNNQSNNNEKLNGDKKKKKTKKGNKKSENGKLSKGSHREKSCLEKLYDYRDEGMSTSDSDEDDDWNQSDESESDIDFSSDSSLMADAMESCEEEEEEEEEGTSEEWQTDSDYTEHSFHESDCYSAESYNSALDDDYLPPIEDKYVKKGEAIFYDASGLDLAFGENSDSQIVELNDVDAVVTVENEDEIPDLVPMNDSQTNDSQAIDTSSSSENMINAEDTLKGLSLDDDEEVLVRSSKLIEHAKFYNCLDDRGVVVRLKAKVHFHGILVIRPLANKVQVNGYVLNTNQSLTASSIAYADYYLNLTPVIDEGCDFDKSSVANDLQKLLGESNDVGEIIATFDSKKEVLIHLQQGLPSPAVSMLKTYCPEPILPHKNMIRTNSVCLSSELILSTRFFIESENPKMPAFRINHDWDYIELNPSIRLMVTGGKNVGKSALTQYLINKNISKFPKILLIDLDIGQPIFAPVQTISATLLTRPLIGAGYLSDITPDKCFLFGDKSVMVSPFKYNEYVSELVRFCNSIEEYKNVPWIVNTMGYQKGFGLQLMCVLLRIVQPTEIVQIQHSNARYNFQSIIKSDLVNGFEFNFFRESYLSQFPSSVSFVTHVLDSVVNNVPSEATGANKWISNATDKRKKSMLAQLSKLLKGDQTYLNDVIPFSTNVDKIQMVVLNEEFKAGGDTKSNKILNLFNGNLVYLCRNSVEPFECFGVGVVRAVDNFQRLIYVLLPQRVKNEKLQAEVTMLALCNVPLPPDILLKQSYSVTGKVPYVTFFKDRGISNKKYINKRNIKDLF